MNPLIIFYNPHSGRFNHSQILQLQAQSMAKGFDCRLVSDIAELSTITHSHIIIAGGDGTVHLTVNTADLITNTFSVVAFGSGNDFIRNFPKRTFLRLLEQIREAVPRAVDLVRINEYYAAVLAGIGFDAMVSDAAKRNWIKWPAVKYIMPVMKHMFFYNGIYMKISGPDFHYEGQVFMLSCGNGFRAGGGFRLFPKARIDDGKMDLLLIEPPTFWQKLKYVWLVNFGKHLNLNIVKYVQTTRVTVELKNDDFFTTDGDVYRAQKMDIEIVPGVLKVIM